MWQWHYPSQFSWTDGSSSDAAASLCSALDHHTELIGSTGGIGCPAGTHHQNQNGIAPSVIYNNGISHNPAYFVGGSVASAAVPLPVPSFTPAAPSGCGHYVSDEEVLLPPNAESSTNAAAMAALSYHSMYGGAQTSSTYALADQPGVPWSTYTVCR
jgi:hypothetical protein